MIIIFGILYFFLLFRMVWILFLVIKARELIDSVGDTDRHSDLIAKYRPMLILLS